MGEFVRNQRRGVEAFLLFALAFCYFSNSAEFHNLSIYQGRDIQRALDLLKQNWIWHGPELSGGGTLPGPFYYWLLALPLSLFGNWESLIWFNIFLASVAAVGFWRFGSMYFSEFSGFIVYVFFITSGVVLRNLKAFWNPSFIFVFQALVLLLLFDSSSKNRKRLILGSLLLGLSLQIHYIQIIFLIAALLAHRKRWVTILVFTFLPLLPHLIWLAGTREGGDSNFSLISGFMNLWETVNFSGLDQQGQKFLRAMNSGDPFFLLSLAMCAFGIFKFLQGDKKVPLPRSPFLWVALGISSLLFFERANGDYLDRYVELFFVLLYVIAAPLVECFEARYRKYFWVLLTGAGGVFFWNTFRAFGGWAPDLSVFFVGLVLASLGILFLYRQERARLVLVSALLVVTFYSAELIRLTPRGGKSPKDLSERTALAGALVRSTGWDYDFLRERTYIVGMNPQHDLSIMYGQAYEKRTQASTQENFDGIFIVHSFVSNIFATNILGDPPNWKSVGKKVPEEVLDLVLRGDLTCARTERVGGFQICYYRLKNSNHMVRWNNLGSPYRFRQPALFTIDHPQGFKKKGPGIGVFFLNDCKNLEASCTVYFEVEVEDQAIRIRAFGDPISIPEAAANPSWAAGLENLRLEANCLKDRKSFAIASHLGVPDYARPDYPAPFFLAPFQRTFECKSPSQIAIRGSDFSIEGTDF